MKVIEGSIVFLIVLERIIFSGNTSRGICIMCRCRDLNESVAEVVMISMCYESCSFCLSINGKRNCIMSYIDGGLHFT